ncbi:MFS transporter [Actinomadura roseirufa]|uniref:MFS transporter n=1 Tax=Actinomadura roseirufa TaxID=2094049 RepID=UPI0013F17313|nr:MFS transporter [Actinomadura roseirufa]
MCAATFLILVDYTAPMTTLPATMVALDGDSTGQVWALNGMPLGLAAFLLVAGRLADDHGRRRLFVAGMATLVPATVVSALAGDLVTFVVSRIVQGAAGAAVIATTLGLIAQAYPAGQGRVRATGLWGVMVGAGIAAGPVVAGAVSAWRWNACYWLIALFSAGLAVAGARGLRESRADARPGADVLGAAVWTVALLAAMTALTETRNGGTGPLVLVPAGVSAVCLVGFVVRQRRTTKPLLALHLLRNRTLLVATSGALVTGMSVIALTSYLPALLQSELAMTPLSAALVLLAWSATSAVAALCMSRLRAVGAARQLILGLAACAAGLAALIGTLGSGAWEWTVPGLAVTGVGSGLVNAALPRLAIDSVPAAYAAMGSGINNTARYVGSAIGFALLVGVVDPGEAQDSSLNVDGGVALAAGLALTGAVGILGLDRMRRRHRETTGTRS